MPILSKPKHEHFAQLVARGEKRGPAYAAVFGESKGADQSACRLLKNAKVLSRIGELSAQISSKLLGDSIRERDFRLKQLQNRHELLSRVIAERAEYAKGDAEWAELGGSTGLVCRDYRGKNADRAVYKVDTGMLAEMRAIEEQAAREMGQRLPGEGGGSGPTAVQVNVTFVSTSA